MLASMKSRGIALYAVVLAIAVAAITCFVPSAAYADVEWTYDSKAKILTNTEGVSLKNVEADNGKNLTIGKYSYGSYISENLDLTGEVGGEGSDVYVITSIGDYAFQGCTALKSVSIPESVTSIGDSAFRGCTALGSICVDRANQHYSSKDGVLFSKEDETLTLVCFPGGKGGQYAVPEGVTAIEASAFAYCTALESVSIPERVTSIGDFAFYSCTALKSVPIPESVTSIGDSAFWGCTSLGSVSIPESVTSIGDYAFYGCTSLGSICVDRANQHYSSKDGVLFSKEDETLTLVCFPGGKGGQYAVPEGVTAIEASAFAYCTSLESVSIPESVTSIALSTFQSCIALKSVLIPESVTSIGDSAFRGCTALGSVSIPESVTSIEGYAFYGCTALESVPIPESVTSIGACAFWGCTSLGSVSIPESVTSIGDSAFYGCTALESVSIPESVTSIEGYAFYGCTALESVSIPESVTTIWGYAFQDCTALKRVAVLAEEPPTLSMSPPFDNCHADLSIVVPADFLEKYRGETGQDAGWQSFNFMAGYFLRVEIGAGSKLDSGLYAADDTIQAPANVAVGEGQHVKWVLEGESGGTEIVYNTLTMPARNVVATCTAEPHTFSGRYCVCGAENPNYVPPVPTYKAKVSSSEGGTASASPSWARAGQQVTVTCSPDEGFEVRSVAVTARDGESVEIVDNGDGTWTFRMPVGGVTVEVSFSCDGGALCPSAGFADVDQSLWYHDAVDVAVSSGIMTGYADGSGLFGPDDALTRAQAATVLWRAIGEQAEAPACGMPDVDSGAWYAPAVDWAASAGFMTGYADGSGLFGPDDALTREQLATVLWRAAGAPSAGAFDASVFSDGADASEWAEPALAWAVSTGVLEGSADGVGGTELRPTDAVTRAEMAAMVVRWLTFG